jgi:hypothetical protein
MFAVPVFPVAASVPFFHTVELVPWNVPLQTW